MRTPALLFVCALLLLLGAVADIDASPYIDDAPSNAVDEGMDDYNENNLERLLQGTQQNDAESEILDGDIEKREPVRRRSSLIYLFRRACVRRGGNCDHRPKDCCYNTSCRCNLWGANCRCQRMGLFQKWGK